ncbi:MAG: hypothetical protein AB8B81_17810 [Halioglobus sp.]
MKEFSGNLMVLKGTARCVSDKIVIDFGGGTTADKSFRVLGGKMVGVADPSPFSKIFGIWESTFIDLESFDEIPAQGHWVVE